MTYEPWPYFPQRNTEAKMTHTPEPWEIGPRHKTIRAKGFERIGVDNGGYVICELFGPDAVDNANLFCAAPELLRLLRHLHDLQNDPPLPKYADEWERVMREVGELLNKLGG
jgi:hypothetical protein